MNVTFSIEFNSRSAKAQVGLIRECGRAESIACYDERLHT